MPRWLCGDVYCTNYVIAELSHRMMVLHALQIWQALSGSDRGSLEMAGVLWKWQGSLEMAGALWKWQGFLDMAGPLWKWQGFSGNGRGSPEMAGALWE